MKNVTFAVMAVLLTVLAAACLAQEEPNPTHTPSPTQSSGWSSEASVVARSTATRTPEEAEYLRLMDVPREELPTCSGEHYTDSVGYGYAYDRSFNSGTRDVCVRGDVNLFWHEFAEHFSLEAGTDVQVEDMKWMQEFNWFEVEVEGRFYYFPTITYATGQLLKRIPECGEQLRNVREQIASEVESEEQRLHVLNILNTDPPPPYYGEWFICSSAEQLEAQSEREEVGNN